MMLTEFREVMLPLADRWGEKPYPDAVINSLYEKFKTEKKEVMREAVDFLLLESGSVPKLSDFYNAVKSCRIKSAPCGNEKKDPTHYCSWCGQLGLLFAVRRKKLEPESNPENRRKFIFRCNCWRGLAIESYGEAPYWKAGDYENYSITRFYDEEKPGAKPEEREIKYFIPNKSELNAMLCKIGKMPENPLELAIKESNF